MGKLTGFGVAAILVGGLIMNAAAQTTATLTTQKTQPDDEVTSTPAAADQSSSETETTAATTTSPAITPAPVPEPTPAPELTPTPTPVETPIPTPASDAPSSTPEPMQTPTPKNAPAADSMTTQTTAKAAATSVTLPNGIVYQVLREGTGRQADTTSTRLVHYTLYLPNGKKLESSRDKQLPVPFSFTPGASEAIIGMQKGTDKMRIGEIRKIYIPSELAYGEKAHGIIPANSDLIFEVELVDLKKPEARAPASAVTAPGTSTPNAE